VSKTLVASGRISTYSTDPQEANKPFNTISENNSKNCELYHKMSFHAIMWITLQSASLELIRAKYLHTYHVLNFRAPTNRSYNM
jgi:hypothetical protein